MRVLVFDAEQRAALACTRNLGARGAEVYTADRIESSLAGASRYSARALCYPCPYTAPDAFVEWIDRIVQEIKPDVLLPVTEVTTDLVVRHRERWPSVQVPFATIEQIDGLSNKVALTELAASIGLTVPRSETVQSHAALSDAAAAFGFPCVLKPARSRVLVDGSWRDTRVIILKGADDLDAVADELAPHFFPAMLQEFVPGRGAGVFMLYEQGQPRAYFAHRRIKEKPPEGGVSVLSESASPDPQLLSDSEKLLDAVGWHGVAMIEYRVGEQGAYLMEVNARFWGSLQLAIDAGVEFPALLLGQAEPQPLGEYRRGSRLRWFLGDLDRLYLQCKRHSELGLAGLLGEFARFIGSTFTLARNETLRLSDPGPGLYELRRYLRNTFGRS